MYLYNSSPELWSQPPGLDSRTFIRQHQRSPPPREVNKTKYETVFWVHAMPAFFFKQVVRRVNHKQSQDALLNWSEIMWTLHYTPAVAQARRIVCQILQLLYMTMLLFMAQLHTGWNWNHLAVIFFLPLLKYSSAKSLWVGRRFLECWSAAELLFSNSWHRARVVYLGRQALCLPSSFLALNPLSELRLDFFGCFTGQAIGSPQLWLCPKAEGYEMTDPDPVQNP